MPFYLLGAAAAGWLAGMLARRDRALGALHDRPFDFPGSIFRPGIRFVPAQPRELRPMGFRSGRTASAWQPFPF